MTTTRTEASPSPRTIPAVDGISHVGLTVRDITASEAWYAEAFGLVRAFAEPHPTGGGYAVVMTRPGTALFVGLEHHPEVDGAQFTPRRTGLDHVALHVTNREDLDEWIRHFNAIGIAHEELVEVAEPVPHALVLVRDPDGIPIELFWVGG
jgi:catechol 2,3-dioxygenase-like lactoylglutathione lyase family enzyme